MDDVVTAVLDDVAPLRKINRGRKRASWLTPEAIAAKRRRRKLERIWTKDGSNKSRIVYRQACRSANKLITDSKRKFIERKLEESAGNPRRQWDVVNNLLHSHDAKSNSTPDDGTFSDRIAAFFHDKVANLKSSIRQHLVGVVLDPFVWDVDFTEPTLGMVAPVTASEVEKLINSMPAKSSPLDFVPTVLLKRCSEVFSRIIARLANLSFSEGMFPNRFKMAQITPILKKPGLDDSELASYRPISNLNTISKILERLFLARLTPQISKSPCYNIFQSAYRKFHNTETALLKLLNDVYCTIDGRKITVLIALDLSAAFDTLDHSTILTRLQHSFGITGPALSWLSTYLDGRSQFVKVGDTRSSILRNIYGVPQGSVLGPTLFACYVAPIASLISSYGVQFHQYADDTQLYIGVSPADVAITVDLLDRCTSALEDWFSQNGMCLNPAKSEVLVLGTRQNLSKLHGNQSFSIAGCSVRPSDKIKNLGVTLDPTLSFDAHVSAVCKASHYHIRALRHIRRTLSTDIAKTVACAIVGSRLDYCNSLLYLVSNKNINKLQHAQNTAARVVLNRPRFIYPNARQILMELHWLPVNERIVHKLATLVFKIRLYHEPSYLDALLVDYVPARSLRSGDRKGLLVVPPSKLVIGSRAFSVAAPALWNELPESIRMSPSVASFKATLKTHLFRHAFT